MSLCFVAVPGLLQGSDAKQLLAQWARMYHNGHLIMPAMAVGTGLLYVYTSLDKYQARLPWQLSAIAALTTVCIAPFTWIFMTATNTELFRLGAQPAGVDIARARALVKTWSSLHFVRSLLPLAGMIMGLSGVFK